jgi:geranylgeranyl diphosphate synthase type II
LSEFNLSAYLNIQRTTVDKALKEYLQKKEDHGGIVSAMLYSLMAGGKRLRPVLCIAASEAVGGSRAVAMPAACALEMIHTYSLIHDDLPAMDDDVMRRGKPTCHVAFDEATAILAGDALLTLAFEILSDPAGDIQPKDSRALRVIGEISRASGCQGMIGGQMLDIRSEGGRLAVSELEKIHRAKTGALIEASVVSGAILGGGRPEEIEQLRIYARNLGLAFQVADDILNVEGDPEVMGKAVGTDQSRRKSTYPSLFGLDHSRALAKKNVGDALQALLLFDNQSDPLKAVAEYVIDRKR